MRGGIKVIITNYLVIVLVVLNGCRNYEHIVKAHQNTPQHGQNQVSDEVKFQVVSHLYIKWFIRRITLSAYQDYIFV